MHRTPRFIAASLAVMALLLASAGSVAAADFRAGDRVTVGADEEVGEDLYVAAGTTVIDGNVDGDVTVAAGTVDVRGTVTGSVNVTGGDITISGSVGGAVRSMGGNLTLSGDVGRDVVLTGGNAVIESGASMRGDIAGAAGNLRVDGSVDGDLLAAVGEMRVEGSVGGTIDANVGQLRIGSTAEIAGDVLYASEREAEIDAGAQIGGDVQRRDPEWAGWRTILPDNVLTSFIGTLLGLLVLGWGLMLVRPAWVLGPGVVLQAQPLLALGAGLAAWIGQFLLLIALAILAAVAAMLAASFGGAFFIPFLIVLLVVIGLIFVAQVFVAMALGGLAGRFNLATSPWLAYAIGAFVWAALLVLLGALAGALGGLAFFIGWLLGLGAIVLRQLALRRRDAAVTVDAPPEVA